MVLADLRRHGVTVGRIRQLLTTLRERFGVRLFETIGEGGRLTLMTDGRDVYGRTPEGDVFNLLKAPDQPLLVVGDEPRLRELTARARTKRRRPATKKTGKGRRNAAKISR
jgi:hypothetical protein